VIRRFRERMKARSAGGWVWWLSILWAGIGAAGGFYLFLASTQPYINSRIEVPTTLAEPWAGMIAAAYILAVLAWLLLTIPVLATGLAQLSGRGLREATWLGAWATGLVLMYLAADSSWLTYPVTHTCGTNGCGVNSFGPTVVSWPELAVCAAWLALGATMTRILAIPAHSRDVPDTSSRSSRKASLRAPGAGDLQP
jgi:hypothetical protein